MYAQDKRQLLLHWGQIIDRNVKCVCVQANSSVAKEELTVNVQFTQTLLYVKQN